MIVLKIRKFAFVMVFSGKIFIKKSRCDFIKLLTALGIAIEVVAFVKIFAGLVFCYIVVQKSFVEVAALWPHYAFSFIKIYYPICITSHFVVSQFFLFYSILHFTSFLVVFIIVSITSHFFLDLTFFPIFQTLIQFLFIFVMICFQFFIYKHFTTHCLNL